MASATFEDVIERMRAEGNLVRNSGTHSIKSVKEILEPIRDNGFSLNNLIKTFLEELSIFNGTQSEIKKILEERNESIERQNKKKDVAGSVQARTDPDFSFGSMGNFNPIGAALTGAFALWVTDTDVYLKTVMIPRIIKGTRASLTAIRKSVLGGFKNIKTNITGYFRGIRDEFLRQFNPKKLMRIQFLERMRDYPADISQAFANVLRPLDTADESSTLSKILSKIRVFPEGLSTNLSKIGSVLKKVFEPLQKAVAALKPAAETASKLLRVLGRFTGILTVVLAAFDFINGFMKGFTEGGVIEGLKQGVVELFNGFVTEPLNLVKDIFAWITKKIGFEDIAKKLEEFDFGVFFSKIYDGIGNVFNFVRNLFSLENIKEKIGDLTDKFSIVKDKVGNIFEFISNMFSMENIKEQIGNLSDSFASIGERIADMIMGFVSSIIEKIPGRKALGILTPEEQEEERRKEIVENQQRLVEIREEKQSLTESGLSDENRKGRRNLKKFENLSEEEQEIIAKLRASGYDVTNAAIDEPIKRDSMGVKTATDGLQAAQSAQVSSVSVLNQNSANPTVIQNNNAMSTSILASSSPRNIDLQEFTFESL